MKASSLLIVATLAGIATSATAQVTALHIMSCSCTTAGGVDAVANVVSIDFAGQYTGSQLLVELTSGEIINQPNVGDTAPSSFLAGVVPDYYLDNYLAQGALLSDAPGAAGTPNLGGGAVNIDPTEAAAVFNDATKISQAWNPGGGVNISDRSDFVVANVVLTPDANGSITYFASAGGEFFTTGLFGTSFIIANGAVTEPVPRPPPPPCIPEPAHAGLLGLGIIALYGRRAA